MFRCDDVEVSLYGGVCADRGLGCYWRVCGGQHAIWHVKRNQDKNWSRVLCRQIFEDSVRKATFGYACVCVRACARARARVCVCVCVCVNVSMYLCRVRVRV